MRSSGSIAPLVLASCMLLIFSSLIPSLYARPRSQPSLEMEVVLPRFVQIIAAAGDRYLAANIAGFRALVASTEKMGKDNYRILGIVQSDIAWFNPAHEDNYYIATAILPWNDEVAASQFILKRASDARPNDWQPPFYYAFNAMHFEKDIAEGAKWLKIASGHTRDELTQIEFQQLAAQWVARGEDKKFAIEMHRAMARETKHKAFAVFLERRATRLENMQMLESAIERYTLREGKPPARIDTLVEAREITSIPQDPFGMRYALDAKNQVVLVNPMEDTKRPLE